MEVLALQSVLQGDQAISDEVIKLGLLQEEIEIPSSTVFKTILDGMLIYLFFLLYIGKTTQVKNVI